jgi:hypothetical protein
MSVSAKSSFEKKTDLISIAGAEVGLVEIAEKLGGNRLR